MINRNISMEKQLNSYQMYKEKFNYDKFFNDFRFQNDDIFKIILKKDNIFSARMLFLENLYNFNGYISKNKLGVIAVIYIPDDSDGVVIEANFSICGQRADDALTTAYEFLSYISKFADFDFEKFSVKDIKNYIYNKSLNEFCLCCNISDLLEHNENKTFHEITFQGIELNELKLQIDYLLRQYNLVHSEQIVYMQGILKETDNGIILKSYISQDADSKIDLSFVVTLILRDLKLFISSHLSYSMEEPAAMIDGEFLDGGIAVGNVEEPLGYP